MPDITFYRTTVVNGVVQADSTLVTLTINDGGDGAISREDWANYINSPYGHVAGETNPPLLWSSSTGSTVTGTLYTPTSFTAGEDLSALLSGLEHNKYEPSVAALNVCYVSGTLIATPDGEVPVEELRAGDLVLTRDHGAQELTWTSATWVTPEDLDLSPNKRPIRITAGSLGNGLPRRDVDVSPQHRVMVTDEDGREYLISARHLMMAGVPGAELRPLGDSFNLVHVAFADHEIILAEGAPMESFYTGKMAVRALSLPQRLGLVISFPELAEGKNPMTPARDFIKHREYAEIRDRLNAG